MPKAKARIIRCRTCGRVILGKKPYRKSKEMILKAIRRHYKKYHPRKFKGFIKKALHTKRKKGIINKHNPHKRKVSTAKVMKKAQQLLRKGVAKTKSEALKRAWEIQVGAVKVRTEPK